MKQRMKRWLSGAMAAVLALTMLTTLPDVVTMPVTATVTQQQINDLKQNASSLASQKKDLKAQLAAIAADKSKALDQKNILEKQINVIQEEINNIAEQIAKYDQLISIKEEELAQNEAEEAAQYELFCKRVRMMEEEGEISYWSILFNSSSFSELLDRFMVVEEIMEYDNAIMDQLLATRELIKEAKTEMEAARKEQEAAKQVQEAAKAELKEQEAAADKLVDQISQQEDQLKAAHKKLEAAAAAMDAEIRKKEKELQAQMAASGTKIVSESGFIWPLSSAKTLTSLFGGRIHPLTGKPNNHTGIDVAAAGGTPIMTTKSGVVITSTYNNSYGNYVVVSHGNGQSTLYAHMRKRAAKVGDTVKQGQVIGYVGTTGSSSGNHLHYEIRLNGSRVDPLNYYKGSTLTLRSGGKNYTYKVP